MKNTPFAAKIAVPILLAAVVGLLILWPNKVVQTRGVEQVSPPTIRLTGIVRDFRLAHDDFDVTNSAAFGHFAGNVQPRLDDGQPVFGGGGHRVETQWKNAAGVPICPTLSTAGATPAELRVVNAPVFGVDVELDTWDSRLGPYGGANIGPPPVVTVGATMPDVPAPTGLPASVGDVAFSGTTVVSSDLHCDRFDIDGLVQIDGQITILCDGPMDVSNHADLELLPGATLDLYLKSGANLGTKITSGIPTQYNGNTQDPDRLRIYNIGTEPFTCRPHAHVFATFVSPNAIMSLKTDGAFFGRYTAKGLDLENHGRMHLDGPVAGLCGAPLNDVAGTYGSPGTGGITSPASFAQWFADVLDTNYSTPHTITLVRNGAGVYEYLDDEFHPVDDQLFGNEGDDHNNCFTYAIDARFAFDACGGQMVEFEGDDDAWLFIDGRLALDLGGLGAGTSQRVEVDRLGLIDGQSYAFLLVYAHRQRTSARFRLRTNLDLSTASVVPVFTNQYD